MVDEPLTAAIALVALPTALVVLIGVADRRAALVAAALMPGVWLALTRGTLDPPALWAIPAASALAVVALARTWRSMRTRVLAGALAPAAVALGLLLPGPGPPADGTPTLLIGIDGASWQCIDATIAAGRMPNIERLLQVGHRARLRSLPSMLSPQVWSAIATGCPPEVNGVWGWDSSVGTFRVGRIWDRMWMDGRTAGTCGWYFTWPPPPFLTDRDFVVPSTLAQDDRAFPAECGFFWNIRAAESGRAAPEASFAASAVRALRSGVRLSTMRRGLVTLVSKPAHDPLGLERAWRWRKLSAELQSDMFAELLRRRRPELGVVLLNQLDKVSHLYWKYREPGGFPDVTAEEAERFGDVIEEMYAEMDHAVGKVLGAVPADANVVIVSDHGFRAALRRTARQYCRVRAERLLESLDATGDVVGCNLDQSVILQVTSGSGADREERLASMESTLRATRIKGEDAPLFEVARSGEILTLRIADRDAVPEDAMVVIGDRERPFDEIVDAALEARFSGEHAPDGVYIMAGPMAAWAAATESLSVLDVAPTMAVILKLPLSRRWTGRPAFEPAAFESAAFGEYPPPLTALEAREAGSAEHLKEMLRSLGYLD